MEYKTEMKCPHCGMTLDIDEIYMTQMGQRFEEQNNLKLREFMKSKEEQMQSDAQKKTDDAVRAAEEKQRLQIEQLTEQIKLLTEANRKQNEQMMQYQKQQFELQQKAQAAELEAQKKFNEQSAELFEKAKKDADEAKELEILELKKKIEDANRASEDLRKKLEQGSQQLQGEVQELRLEESLRAEFPLDTIEEVEKGKLGADVIQTVVSRTGRVCGKIVWESKNVKGWKNEFLPKLRSDMERVNGDVGILVSNVFGKNMNEFMLVEGVWLIRPQNVLAIARLIRDRIEAVSNTRSVADNKETIQEAVYAFVTSAAFRNRIENIGRQYRALDEEIVRTEDSMRKHWATQRKLIDQLMGNTQGILGEVNAFLLQADNGEMELEPSEDLRE